MGAFSRSTGRLPSSCSTFFLGGRGIPGPLFCALAPAYTPLDKKEAQVSVILIFIGAASIGPLITGGRRSAQLRLQTG